MPAKHHPTEAFAEQLVLTKDGVESVKRINGEEGVTRT